MNYDACWHLSWFTSNKRCLQGFGVLYLIYNTASKRCVKMASVRWLCCVHARLRLLPTVRCVHIERCVYPECKMASIACCMPEYTSIARDFSDNCENKAGYFHSLSRDTLHNKRLNTCSSSSKISIVHFNMCLNEFLGMTFHPEPFCG